MEATSWQNLLSGIRPDDQRSLVVRTIDSLEIAVEEIARLEDEVVLLKGRIAGSADSRRIFIIPYDKLTAFYINRPVMLEEVDLFSTKLTLEEKEKLAKEIEENARRAKEEQEKAGLDAQNKGGIDRDVRSQLDELRRMAQARDVKAAPDARDPEAASDAIEQADQQAITEKPAAAIPAKTLAIPASTDPKPNNRFNLPARPRR